MALTTHPLYGDTEQLYNILSTSGLFTSVTKTIVEGTKTITCSDTSGTRLVITVTNVNPDGSGGDTIGYTYYYGGDKTFYCLDESGSAVELRNWRFPCIVYQTTSTIVIDVTNVGGSEAYPHCVLVLTKDNNGYVGVFSSNNYANWWGNSAPPWSVSKDAASPLKYYDGSGSSDAGRIARLGSASALVPITTNDFSKVVYFPKLFRAVSSQYQSNNIGLASLNDNQYLSLYGAVFVRID